MTKTLFQPHGQFRQGQTVQPQISVQTLVFLEAGPLRAQRRRFHQQAQHGFPVGSGKRGRRGGHPGRYSACARPGRDLDTPGKKELRAGLFAAVGIIKRLQQRIVWPDALPG